MVDVTCLQIPTSGFQRLFLNWYTIKTYVSLPGISLTPLLVRRFRKFLFERKVHPVTSLKDSNSFHESSMSSASSGLGPALLH